MLYCFLADGFEETEAIAPIDMLKRAKIAIKTVGVGGAEITGAHAICVKCDMADSDIVLDGSLEGIILPGGMPGTLNLEKSAAVQQAIDYCAENGKLICAICAAPSVLGHKGLLYGKEAIAFPGFEDELKGAKISSLPVVKDGNFITAKGAGVALQFGLEIVSALKGAELAQEIKRTIQMI